MHFKDDVFTEEDIQDAFENLTKEQQHEFQMLRMGRQSERDSRLKAIFSNNAFATCTGPRLFLKISRINHSCTPNALADWNSKIERQTVHLTRDVALGDEIAISYCDPREEFEVRRKNLHGWNFTCDCKQMRVSLSLFHS